MLLGREGMKAIVLAVLLATLAPVLAHAQSPAPPPLIVVVPAPSAALAAPATAPTAPPPRVDETRTHWSLVAPGIAMLAGGWAIGWLTTFIWNLASAQCHSGTSSGFISGPTVSCDPPLGPYGEGDWQMAIPLVGPFLTFIGDDTFRGADIWFPVTMAALEIGGLGLLIAGLATPEHARRPAAWTPEVRVGLGSMQVTMAF